MARRIGYSEVEQPPASNAYSAGSSAALLEEAAVTLRFRLTSTDDVSLEAIRYARRAMLREEWTRGAVEGEPSLEDAVFSTFDVAWEVPAEHRERCRAKLEELVARADPRARRRLGFAAAMNLRPAPRDAVQSSP